MSDTPLTDAYAFSVRVSYLGQKGPETVPNSVVPADFARIIERERDALLARAEKAEAAFWPHRDECERLRGLLAQAEEAKFFYEGKCRLAYAERDALRKALSGILTTATDCRYSSVSGRFEALNLIEKEAHAALHGTAKLGPEPHTRTCGECDANKYCQRATDAEACGGFTPRADAKKGGA